MTFYDVSRCVIVCVMMFWWCLSSNFWVCLMMFDNFWLLPKEGDPVTVHGCCDGFNLFPPREELKMDGWGRDINESSGLSSPLQPDGYRPTSGRAIVSYTLAKVLGRSILGMQHRWGTQSHSKQGSGRAKSFIHVKHVKHQGNPRPESQPGDGYSIPLKDHVQVQSSRHPQSNLQES